MITNNSKLAVVAGVFACGFLMLTAQVAEAVEFSIGGQVNRVVRFAESGDEDGENHQDGAEAASRITFKAWQTFGDDQLDDDVIGDASAESARSSAESSAESIGWGNTLTLWTILEISLLEDQDGVDEDFPDINGANSDEDAQLRRAALGIAGKLGQFIAGRYDSASYGLVRTDLSASGLAVNNDHRNNAGIFVRDMGGFTFDRLGEWVGNGDGRRVNTVRYDTPRWRGCFASIAHSDDGDDSDGDEMSDAALRCSKNYEDAGVKVAGGLQWQNWDGEGDSFGGTASILHTGTGLSFTGSYNTMDFDATGRDDADNFYAKLGYDFNEGRTGIGAAYGESTDHNFNGADAEHFEFGVQHNVVGLLDLYTSYMMYETDDNGTDNEDVDVIIVGARLKF